MWISGYIMWSWTVSASEKGTRITQALLHVHTAHSTPHQIKSFTCTAARRYIIPAARVHPTPDTPLLQYTHHSPPLPIPL